METIIRGITDPIGSSVMPPMTDPLGKHWDQPSAEDILIDDTHALMTEQTFKQLAKYSVTVPTGCYPGKMWRCDLSECCNELRDSKDRHQLRWFGVCPEKPEKRCTNHQRTIILI